MKRLTIAIMAGLAVLPFVSPTPAAGTKVFTLDWVAETSGTIASPNEFDVSILMTYLGGLAGVPDNGGATVSLYLYDDSGAPLTSATPADVCNPCVFPLSNGNNQETARIDNLITVAGGFPAAVVSGFGIITVNGDDEQVALQAFITNSHTGPFDVSTLGLIPREISTTPVTARLLTFLGAAERDGTIAMPDQFDTTIYGTYAGGLGGIPAGAGAAVHLYMFDRDTGAPAQGALGDVCNPCTIALSAGTPHESFRLHDAFLAAGGFVSAFENVDVLAVIAGDANLVSLTGVIVNSHTGPFDVSMASVGNTEHPYQGRPAAVGPDGSVLAPGLRSLPNPFNPSVAIEYVVREGGPVRIEVADVQGRIVATLIEQWHDAGTYTARWDGEDAAGQTLPSGVYFARMTSKSGTRTLKMTLLR